MEGGFHRWTKWKRLNATMTMRFEPPAPGGEYHAAIRDNLRYGFALHPSTEETHDDYKLSFRTRWGANTVDLLNPSLSRANGCLEPEKLT